MAIAPVVAALPLQAVARARDHVRRLRPADVARRRAPRRVPPLGRARAARGSGADARDRARVRGDRRFCTSRCACGRREQAAARSRPGCSSLVCAAWVGEDSVIRAYGFYGYAPEWSLFVDQSAAPHRRHLAGRDRLGARASRAVSSRMRSRASRVALAGGLIVLADASLIEPIAVHAHLWSWSAANARAVFDVPRDRDPGVGATSPRRRSRRSSWRRGRRRRI